jgi:hypothetical protein
MGADESVNGGDSAMGLAGLRKKVHSNRDFTQSSIGTVPPSCGHRSTFNGDELRRLTPAKSWDVAIGNYMTS